MPPYAGRGTVSHVNLRSARHDESLELADLWLRSRKASVPAIPPPAHSEEEVRAWFRDVVLPESHVVVAEVDGSLIGLLVLDGDWVDQLYVEPNWTGKGVGSRLICEAKERRPTGLQLWTFLSNEDARRFYERHGFVSMEATDGDNEERAPDIRYEWRGHMAKVPPKVGARTQAGLPRYAGYTALCQGSAWLCGVDVLFEKGGDGHWSDSAGDWRDEAGYR